MRIAGDDVLDAFDLDRESIVEPDADMARAGKVDQIFDVVGQPLGIGAALAEEAVEAHDADDAAGTGASLDLVIGDVAPVSAERLRVGVREDHRPVRIFHHVHRGAIARMGHVHEHAEAVHFVDHLPAECGQTCVLVVAPAAGEIVAVVGEQHLSHAEAMVECGDCLFPGQEIEADIDGKIVDACVAPDPQIVQVRGWVGHEAGMRIPDDFALQDRLDFVVKVHRVFVRLLRRFEICAFQSWRVNRPSCRQGRWPNLMYTGV